MSKKGFSRLEFLKAGAMSTAALGTGALGRTFQKPDTKKSSFGDAKNVIFLVVDGMSSGTMALADLLKQRQYGEKTNWIKLYESDREYHRGLMDMASLNSVVTGSAAAASSPPSRPEGPAQAAIRNHICHEAVSEVPSANFARTLIMALSVVAFCCSALSAISAMRPGASCHPPPSRKR